MTKDQKVIRAKVGLLELAKQLGDVSQACKMMGPLRQGRTTMALILATAGLGQVRDYFACSEKTAFGSRSRLGAHGIASKPPQPLPTLAA